MTYKKTRKQENKTTDGSSFDSDEVVLNQNTVHSLLKMSCREGDIIRKITEGKSNKTIATELYISIRTVENTRYRICKKLGLKGKGALKHWVQKLYSD